MRGSFDLLNRWVYVSQTVKIPEHTRQHFLLYADYVYVYRHIYIYNLSWDILWCISFVRGSIDSTVFFGSGPGAPILTRPCSMGRPGFRISPMSGVS